MEPTGVQEVVIKEELVLEVPTALDNTSCTVYCKEESAADRLDQHLTSVSHVPCDVYIKEKSIITGPPNKRNASPVKTVGGAKLLPGQQERRQRRRRRWQTRPVNQQRSTNPGEYQQFLEIKEKNPEQFFNYTRMSRASFEELLALIGPSITKFHGRAIGAQLKLALTLRFLSNGGTMHSLALAFNLGLTTVAVIIPEVCTALWECLKAGYVPEPSTEEWLRNAEGFASQWDMPLCLGGICGKHILIKAPNNASGVANSVKDKNSYCIVLMAVANDRHEFSLVNVGEAGAEGDIAASSFDETVLDNMLDDLTLPSQGTLPKTHQQMPYFFIGDEFFPLKQNIMCPYPKNDSTETQQVFNYRLSRARRVVDNSFGILATRWRIYQQTITVSVATAFKVVLATVALHNFLMKKKDCAYCPEGLVDVEADGVVTRGSYHDQLSSSQLGPHPLIYSESLSTQAAQRDELALYLMSLPGSVPWQLEHIRKGKL